MKFSKTDVLRSVCRESYWDFVQKFWHTVVSEEPVWNWHMEVMANDFQNVMERVFKGLPREGDTTYNVPPGTSKSTLLSVLSMPWVWTRLITGKGIFASYSYDLALDLSRKARDCVLSDLYKETFPEVKLREDQNTKGYFTNTAGGYRYSVGVKGSVTGYHGHLIVVDDPLDPNQAVSGQELPACNRWLQHTLPSRKVDKRVTPTILVMQRLHEDDPTALFQRRTSARHFCLPAELTDDVKPKSLRKKYNKGLLDPKRLPRSVLREAEEDLGQYAYAGQFLQAPSPPEGGMFKVEMIQIAQGHPEMVKVCRFWDKAASDNDNNYTAGIKMGRDKEGGFWILHVVRVRVDSAKRERLIRRTAEADGYDCEVGIEQEPGSGGKESAEGTAKRLAGFKVRVLKVGRSSGDKVERADPFSVQVNSGNVTLLQAPWNETYKSELRHFPNGKYLDQTDGSSGAFSLLYKKRRRCGAGPVAVQQQSEYSFSTRWY